MRKVAAWLFVCAVLALEPFAQHGLAALSTLLPPVSCSCIGDRDAPVRIVYLHGLDTRAPSWIELQNRAKLRALAGILPARIALPRASEGWTRGALPAEPTSIIETAAWECLGTADFVLLGFSDGANLANQLFLHCRTDVTPKFVSVGSSEGSVRRGPAPAPWCGRIVLLAGRHEAGSATTRMFARQLAKRGASAEYIEHPGPHELPGAELVRVLRDLGASADDH